MPAKDENHTLHSHPPINSVAASPKYFLVAGCYPRLEDRGGFKISMWRNIIILNDELSPLPPLIKAHHITDVTGRRVGRALSSMVWSIRCNFSNSIYSKKNTFF